MVTTVAFCTAIVLIGNAPLAGILMAVFFPAKLLPLELTVTVMAWEAGDASGERHSHRGAIQGRETPDNRCVVMTDWAAIASIRRDRR